MDFPKSASVQLLALLIFKKYAQWLERISIKNEKNNCLLADFNTPAASAPGFCRLLASADSWLRGDAQGSRFSAL